MTSEEAPPAQSLPGHTAGDHSDGVEVCVRSASLYIVEAASCLLTCVGNQVPEHAQEVADSGRVDVGLVQIGVDEVRQTNQGVEEITEREVEDQDDGVQLQN